MLRLRTRDLGNKNRGWLAKTWQQGRKHQEGATESHPTLDKLYNPLKGRWELRGCTHGGCLDGGEWRDGVDLRHAGRNAGQRATQV